MYNYCKKTKIDQDKLIMNIDLTNNKSWNLNSDYIVNSSNIWNKAVSNEINLIDYGLTMYDNGRVSDIEECYQFENNDKTFKMYRVGANDDDGNIDFSDYNISGMTTNNQIGNYFYLNGGYLQGFFKLEDYEYEILPARFMNGFTIETLIRVDNDSEGIFYYMGTRSEDKYNTYFSGETYINNNNNYDGILTSERNLLSAYIDEEVISNAFGNYEEEKYHIEKLKENQLENLKNNVISFEVTSDKKIKIKRIDIDGNLKEYTSDNILKMNWNLISFTFIPDTSLPEYNSQYKCYGLRKGTLKVYVNGYLFWKLNNFDEFYFKPINNHKEKQIGVPYNISWGGGSFGLKHSYHYDYNNIVIYDNDDLTYIDNNFIVDGDANLTYDSTNELMKLNINNGTNIILEYDNQIEVLGGHKYRMTCFVSGDIYNNFIDLGEIKLKINSNFEQYELLDEHIYTTKRINPEWVELIFEFRIAKDCNFHYFYPQIEITSETGFISGSNLKIKDWFVETTNILTQDPNKEDLYIEKYFSSSFIGAIQKLRLYDRPLNNDEILNNAEVESQNEYYNIDTNVGGRIIYE